MSEDSFPKHPLQRFVDTKWPFALLGLMLALTGLMQILDPNPSIVDFEFAYDFSTAESIMAAWGEEGIRKAKWSTYLDFFYLIVYSSTFTLFILRATKQFEPNSTWFFIGTL